LERWPDMVGEDEDGRMEGRVGPPPAPPLRVLVPARRPELVGSHDLGSDPLAVLLGERVVEAVASLLGPEPGADHPLVETLAGVTERGFQGLGLTRGEPVEGDREVVDTDSGHDLLLTRRPYPADSARQSALPSLELVSE